MPQSSDPKSRIENRESKKSLPSFHVFTTSALFFLFSIGLLAAANSLSVAKFGPKWNSLVGEWKTEPGSGPVGVCGFHFDLADHVIVRTNHAELSATGAAHNDLMVISPEPAPDKGRASYYDNEGHVIEYAAEWSADGNILTFSSKAGPG